MASPIVKKAPDPGKGLAALAATALADVEKALPPVQTLETLPASFVMEADFYWRGHAYPKGRRLPSSAWDLDEFRRMIAAGAKLKALSE